LVRSNPVGDSTLGRTFFAIFPPIMHQRRNETAGAPCKSGLPDLADV
jgi:hypothetical protein